MIIRYIADNTQSRQSDFSITDEKKELHNQKSEFIGDIKTITELIAY